MEDGILGTCGRWEYTFSNQAMTKQKFVTISVENPFIGDEKEEKYSRTMIGEKNVDCRGDRENTSLHAFLLDPTIDNRHNRTW